MNDAIVFESVSKTYPLYHHVQGGLKSFAFRAPKLLKALRTDGYTAIQDISFSVKSGECFGVIGRNGAGKSTLLGLAAGVIRPSEGQVNVNGRVAPMLELGGGFHPDLTGRENIMLNGVLLGMSRADVRAAMGRIIEFSGLEEFIDEPIRIYSSGMLAKLGFSVITQLEPDILIIDEVLAVGDIDFQKKCRTEINGFRKRGVTILFVSHSMDDIKSVCDRVIWIENHRIRMSGHPDDVIRQYTTA
jgi:lipopolysaccharide transport system ATP-binding protein